MVLRNILNKYSDAGRWKTLGGPVAIDGDNLPSLGWNRVNWSAKYWRGQWPPLLPRFRHHCAEIVRLVKFHAVFDHLTNSLNTYSHNSLDWMKIAFGGEVQIALVWLSNLMNQLISIMKKGMLEHNIHIPITGPSEGLKIRGCQNYLVGIICPPWLR